MRGSIRATNVAASLAPWRSWQTPGSAAVPSTPSAVSTAFVQGYLTADPAACDLATPRMQQLFARLVKGATCKAALAAARAETDAVADKDARSALRETVQATQVLIDAPGESDRHAPGLDRAAYSSRARWWRTCARTTSR